MMTRTELEALLAATGWTCDAESTFDKVNSFVSLNPSGADDDTAVCGAIDALHLRRAVSYAAAANWARGFNFDGSDL